ncbi:hypothetical protein J4438_00855 [Candidatus Woesearchaeota archaeon]|nr:hypothetical protein [Candidatus Woesearchaeota archaeon]
MQTLVWYESERATTVYTPFIETFSKRLKNKKNTSLSVFTNLEESLSAITPPLNMMIANHPSPEDMVGIGKYIINHPDTRVIITRAVDASKTKEIADSILPRELTKSSTYSQISFLSISVFYYRLDDIIPDQS